MATGATAQLKGYDSMDVYSEELGNNFAYNVVAKLPGTDRGLRDEFVIMGGHLDHLGVRNGQVYNGADDNASGTAVAMEVARVLSEGNHRPRRTIVFAAWCGEEMGLIGSSYFVANPPEGIDMDHTVVTYFNMDMVGLGNAIGAPGALNFPTIWDVIKRDQDPDVIAAVRPRTGGPGGSDHSAFINLGIESLGLMTSGGVGHPYYHRPEDDTEKIDAEILRKTGQFVLQGAINLAEERETELLIEDRQHIFNAMQLSINSFNPGQGAYESVAINARTKDDLMKVVMDSALAVNARLQEQQAAPAQPTNEGPGWARCQRRRRPSTGESATSPSSKGTLPSSWPLRSSSDSGGWISKVMTGTGFSGGSLTADGRQALRRLRGEQHLGSPGQPFREPSRPRCSPLPPSPSSLPATTPSRPPWSTRSTRKGVVLGVTMDPSDVRRMHLRSGGHEAAAW